MARPRLPLHQLADPSRAKGYRMPIAEVSTGAPTAPPWLPEDLVPEFRRRAEDLARLKHTDERDADALACLVVAANDILIADKALAEAGRYITGARGSIQPHPAIKDRESALKRIAQAIRTLGVSPTGRGQVATPPEPPKVDPDSDEAFLKELRGE